LPQFGGVGIRAMAFVAGDQLVFDAGVAGRKWQQQIPPLRYGMTKKGGRYRMAKSAVGVE
jgi:hypothetical protein